MLSIEDISIKKTLDDVIDVLISGKAVDENQKESLTRFEKLDLTNSFSVCLTRLAIAGWLRKIFADNKIRFRSLRTIDECPLKNVHLYEYTYELPNGEKFYAILASKNENAPSSLYSLADSLFAWRVTDGCSNCDYSKEGCERCGFNKARKLINNNGFNTFVNTCDPFIKFLGDKLNPLKDLIDWTIKYRKTHSHQEDIEETQKAITNMINEVFQGEESDEDEDEWGLFSEEEEEED